MGLYFSPASTAIGKWFCFGGIGATPDDYTRQVSANAFTDGKMEFHEEAKERIINQFGEEAYPHRINMAYLPINAKLLKNVVNDVSGFYLEDRFFFTPGFPSMSQSMVLEALDRHYTKSNIKKYRKTVTIVSSENDLIEVMKKIPTHLEFSSLPKIIGEERRVVISVAGYNQDEVNFAFKLFLDFCLENKKEYVLEDINDI